MLRYAIHAAVLIGAASVALAGDTNFPSRIIIQAADSAPTCSSATLDGELCVEGDLEVKTNLIVAGTMSVTGVSTHTGDAAFTGTITGLRKVIAGGAAYTVSAPADCGSVVTTATDTGVITLPDAATANKGCHVTIINTGADGAALISISPHSSDGIDGNCIGVTGAGNATLVNLSGTVNKDAQNTKATAQKGDSITLVSDGSAGWYVTSCFGVWASES